jgi:arylsulfatase A-like enzyme
MAVLMVGTISINAANQQATSGKTKTPRPNILLIIGDDIGIDATTDMYPGMIDNLVKQYGPSGHNHPKYQDIKGRPASTPTLNSLAKSGMRFSQAWMNPFCSPTRTSILTGLYAAKTEVLDYTNWLSQVHHSFIKDLKEKGGYATAVFGKYHMAGLGQYPGMKPKEAGFDLFRGNLHGGVATYWDWDYQIQDSTDDPDKWRTEKPPLRSLPGVKATTYAPVVNAADAIEWINEQKSKNPNKPWFAWLAFNLSHISGNQKPNPMIVPNIDTMDDAAINEMKACGGTFGSAIVGKCTSEMLMRGMTNSMDTIISKVLAVVEKIPNTYVIYIGDNGTWMFGEGREFIDNMYITKRGRSKGTAYESGARVSMVIRGPRIQANSQCDVPIHGVDLFSTFLELAGLDIPKTVPNRKGQLVALDSVSLTPLLFNGTKTLRDPNSGYLLAETLNPVMQNQRQAGARNTKYKVICTEKTDTASCTFYNLVDDPIEEYPLAKPDSCANYKNGTWTTANPEWHFCRLQEVLAKESFLATPKQPESKAQKKGQPSYFSAAALAE